MLVGITPNGTLIFLSKLYSGSISDAMIVSKSGFIDKIEAGDDVMAEVLIFDIYFCQNVHEVYHK